MAAGQVSFFADMDSLVKQSGHQDYGVINENCFQTTSIFRVKEECNAYAVVEGHILLLKQNPDIIKSPINLILKPLDTMNVIPLVKYIIYRGLDYESFFDDNGDLIKEGSDYLLSLSEGYSPDERIPKSRYFTPEELSADDIDLEDIFSGDVGLINVQSNSSLGKFRIGEDIGVDIVLDSDHEVTIGMAKMSAHTISWFPDREMSASEKKYMRESVCNYIDPLVFFAMNGIVTSSFSDKRKTYFDIRGNLGYSFNYLNYGTDKRDIIVNGEHYGGNSEWPIYIVEADQETCRLQIQKPAYAGDRNIIT